YDKAPEKTWAKMPDANANILGIDLDPKRKVVYAGSRNTKTLYRISTDDPTKIDKLADVEGGFNGSVLGEDEAVYYTDQGGGNVFRVAPDGTKSKVTLTPLMQPNDIAFGPDGMIYVNEAVNPATVFRFKLDANHMEVMGSREMYAKFGSGNGDGVGFDKAGN